MTPEAARKFTMLSGRYQGKPLAFLPTAYLEWIVREHGNETLKKAARAILKSLKRQRSESPSFTARTQSRMTRPVQQPGPLKDLKELLATTPKGLF